jgi:hypothetical protein
MNYDTFRVQVTDLLQAEADKHANGEVKWNVSNQHDEYYVESALENFTNEDNATLTNCYVVFNAELPHNIMSLVHIASTFDVEPLAEAWTR